MTGSPEISLLWPDAVLLACARQGQKPRGAAQLVASDYNSISEGRARGALAGRFPDHQKRRSAKVLVTFRPPTPVGNVPPEVLKTAIRPALRGVAAALGVPLSGLRLSYDIGEPVVGGRLNVKVGRVA